MDSFYPKIDEVELVLVEDNNDFYDPLESNFECDDENEDEKLQLNDTIYEDNQFNLSIDDRRSSSSTDESITQIELVKLEVIDDRSDNEKTISNWIKIESSSDSSNDAFDRDDFVDRSHDNNSYTIIEAEPTDTSKQTDFNGTIGSIAAQPNENVCNYDRNVKQFNVKNDNKDIEVEKKTIENLPEAQNKRITRKLNSTNEEIDVRASSSRTDIKKEKTCKKSQRKEIKV